MEMKTPFLFLYVLGLMSQFGFLLRQKSSLRPHAQRFLDLVDPDSWLLIPGWVLLFLLRGPDSPS